LSYEEKYLFFSILPFSADIEKKKRNLVSLALRYSLTVDFQAANMASFKNNIACHL
jgi:hypothetical protein